MKWTETRENEAWLKMEIKTCGRCHFIQTHTHTHRGKERGREKKLTRVEAWESTNVRWWRSRGRKNVFLTCKTVYKVVDAHEIRQSCFAAAQPIVVCLSLPRSILWCIHVQIRVDVCENECQSIVWRLGYQITCFNTHTHIQRTISQGA